MEKTNIRTAAGVLYAVLWMTAGGIVLLPADEKGGPVPGKRDTIRLAAIKFIIDDSRYVFSAGEACPENSGDAVRISTVLSYTELRPGMELSAAALEKKAARLKLRLKRSQLFIGTEVYVAPPRKDPASRTLMVKLRTGLLNRFAAGAAWAGLNMHSTRGRRDSLFIAGGANLLSLGYRNENIAGKGLTAAFSLEYHNSLFDSRLPGGSHQLKAETEFGILLHPDLYAGLKAALHKSVYEDGESGLQAMEGDAPFYLLASPLLSFQLTGSPLLKAGLTLQLDCVTGAGIFAPSLKIDEDLLFEPSMFFLGQKIRISQAFARLPLSEQPDITLLLRSPLAYEDSISNSLYFCSFESGVRLFSLNLFGIFPLSVQLFAFYDAALLSGSGLYPGRSGFADAFGPGIRILFSAPVFLKIDLSAGWNCRREYQINFKVTGG
jgi:hypothetical protein